MKLSHGQFERRFIHTCASKACNKDSYTTSRKKTMFNLGKEFELPRVGFPVAFVTGPVNAGRTAKVTSKSYYCLVVFMNCQYLLILDSDWLGIPRNRVRVVDNYNNC